jgi:hypothetical protein
MYLFGSGKMWAFDQANNNSPIEFGDLQSVSLDFSFDQKALHGSKKYPIKVVQAKGKIDAKASFANIRPNALNTVLGGSISTGQKKIITESKAIPATPFAITVENGANFERNLGVVNVSNPILAVPMVLVTETPTTGQYTLDKATGKYTFADADTGKDVQITYMYEDTTTGKTIVLDNSEMGTAPMFSTYLNGSLDGIQIGVWLSACISSKLSLALKQEDFAIPDFDIGAFVGSDGTPGWISFGE